MTSCNESTTAWLSSGISLGTPGGGIDIVSKVSPVGSGLSLEFTLEPGKISKKGMLSFTYRIPWLVQKP